MLKFLWIRGAVQDMISVGNSFWIQISFVHNIRLNNPIVLKFCTEHGSITVVLCAKFQYDWTTETNVMDERYFSRFEFEISFRRISAKTHGRYSPLGQGGFWIPIALSGNCKGTHSWMSCHQCSLLHKAFDTYDSQWGTLWTDPRLRSKCSNGNWEFERTTVIGQCLEFSLPQWHECVLYFDGLVHDYSNSRAFAMQLLQSCTKPSIYCKWTFYMTFKCKILGSCKHASFII